MARLRDICEIVSGTTPKSNVSEYWDGEINWITPAELNDDTIIIYESQRKITEQAVKDSSLKPFPAGTVILSSRAPIGKVAIAGVDMYCNQGFKNLICSEKIHNKYLFWFLKGRTAFLNSLGRGATFKEISKSIVENIEIPLPPVEEQKKYASILDKVSDLISLRKQQLATLDELVKARFVEMFGDISFNTNGYPMVKLGDIAFITKLAGFEYTEHIHYKDHGDIIMVRGLNCKKTKLVLDDIYWIDQTTSDILPRSKLFAGDILMTYVGTVGEVALIDADNRYHLAPNVAKISLNDKKAHVPEFFVYMFMYCRDYIMKHASTTTQAALSMGKIRDIAFPIPPTDLQIQFSIFIKQVSGMQLTIQQSLDKMEVLKKSLMQEYFG